MSVTTLAAPPDNTRALLEFQSPTAAVIADRIPVSGRVTIWVIAAAILSSIGIMGCYPVDRVVAAPGKVVAKIPNMVVQPLDTSIIRQIDVHEGEVVHAGDRLAMLDPTFAAADAGSLDTQVASLQAEVDRLDAEAEGRSYLGNGSPPSQLQAMIFAQRHAERTAKLETYRQRIDSAKAKVAQTETDIASYAEEFRVAQTKEGMRKQLEQMQVGSRLNTLDAGAQRAEINRSLQAAFANNAAAKSDLDGLIAERDAYVQQIKGETAQQLTEQGRKLSDALEQQNKARLRRNLVDLRADRDAVVLSVAKVSVGSVVQSGDELITLVPTDAPLEIEASIPARDAGFVQAGNPAVIKFDTFPYTTYGYATGTLNTVSADSFSDARNGRERPSRPPISQPEANGGATFFRAGLSLDEMKLHNLPAGFHMTPGMPVTADIKVGRRTVLAYLMSRVVPTLTEGMREP
ncbi:MAG: HlyD family type I secretion periplasmic adaptor subunit [Rhodopila sp.]|nr:HlyD family type I secretion periplasmic adaptor subunit [Rhodopila sp.]